MEAEIIKRLEEIIKYLKPLLPLANCHMVNFITHKLWHKYVSDAIRDEVRSVSIRDLNKMFVYYAKDLPVDEVGAMNDMSILTQKSPHFSLFLATARNMSLRGYSSENIITRKCDLQEKFTAPSWRGSDNCCMERIMSEKKMHEVEVMSDVVAALAHVSRASHIIDVGGGKGYLSSFLSLYHNIRVLGVDSSQTNTHGAAKRSKKLERVWAGLCRRADMLKKGNVPPRRGKHWKSHNKEDLKGENAAAPSSSAEEKSLYKQVTEFVTPQTNLSDLIKQQFESESYENFGIVGLHTCGNLAASCMRIFVENEEFASLCNIGCCYHLMEEKYCQSSFWNDVNTPSADEVEHGFPLSRFLHEREFQFGRNARMLAAQSLDRMGEHHQIQSESLFFRALLQVLLLDKCGGDDVPWGQVGHLFSKSRNFEDYVLKAIEKLSLDIEVTTDEIENLYRKHISDQDQLHIFFLLRVSLAPVIEAVILLDRLLYLHEQGIRNSFLVKLFDPVISPRCYCITALKDCS